MDLQDFRDHVRTGAVIEACSAQHAFLVESVQGAMQITAKLDGGFRTPDEVRGLLSEPTCRTAPESVTVFDALTSDDTRNRRIPRRHES